MKLADTEIRDINEYLQAAQPLPDKYRFMLFGDVREVELVWNGKSNEVRNKVVDIFGNDTMKILEVGDIDL